MRVDEGEHLDELVAAYVLGALEPDEVEAVELHLEECEACRALVEEERRAVELLPYLAEPQPVPLRARRALLARVSEIEAGAELPAAAPRRIPARVARLSWVAAATAAVLALAFAWNSFQMQSQVERTAAENAVLAEQRNVVIEVTQGGFITDFNRSGASGGAEGSVIVNPSANTALVLVKNMPRPKKDHAYVVWLVRGNQHINAGMLVLDENGNGQLPITPRETIAGIDGIVITEESGPLVASPSGVRLMTAWVDGN